MSKLKCMAHPAAMTIMILAACGLASPAAVDASPPVADGPRIDVKRSQHLETSQLIIPRKFLPGEKVGATSSSTRTIVAGTALTAGIAICGLVLLRRRGLTVPVIVVSATVGGLLIGGACVVANSPPPARRPNEPPQMLYGDRPVSIVVVDGGDKIELILDYLAGIDNGLPADLTPRGTPAAASPFVPSIKNKP